MSIMSKILLIAFIVGINLGIVLLCIVKRYTEKKESDSKLDRVVNPIGIALMYIGIIALVWLTILCIFCM